MSELAILGGEPVRKTPFFSSVVVDDRERQCLLEVIDRKGSKTIVAFKS